ncbi:MAG: TolC family protein [Planctomycetota bacterium]|jgi:cobalt-zinc-cadmium efflux system outer membrane protein
MQPTSPRRARSPRSLLWSLTCLAACTPAAYHGQAPSFYLQPLPTEPQLAADGSLDRSTLPRLADEHAPATGPIAVSLDRALRVSALTHPRVRSLLETVVQARANHITASLLPNPRLGLSYTLAPFPGGSFDATQRQGGPPQFDLGLGLVVDTLLFGKRAAGIKLAELEVDAALAQYADLGRQLMLGLIDDYFVVVQSDALRALQQEEHEEMQRFVEALARQVELGGATRIELDRARTALALTQRRLVQSEADFDNSLTRFRAWLGGTEGGERAVPVAGLDAASDLTATELGPLLTLANDQRPDLVAARRDVASAEAQLAYQECLAWPSMVLTPGATRQFQSSAIGFPNANSWGIGLDASLPLFDRNQGNIAAAASMLRQAQLELEVRTIAVRAEVAQALRDFQAARASATIVDQTALQAARSARDGIESARALGSRTLLEVLDARAAYREVQREQVRARTELQRAANRLRAIVASDTLR